MQRLLGEAVWDADKVRDDVRGYVVDNLGDPGGSPEPSWSQSRSHPGRRRRWRPDTVDNAASERDVRPRRRAFEPPGGFATETTAMAKHAGKAAP
jgi:hypothetical protein